MSYKQELNCFPNIILIGFSGSGKSTIAAVLGKITHYNILDTDQIIEKKIGISIFDIFKLHGEGFFRNLENQVKEDLIKLKSTIIASGGGFFHSTDELKFFSKNNCIIFLKASVETILDRLKKDISRPLLASTDLNLKIRNLIKERQDIYSLASFHIDVNKLTPNEVAREVLKCYCLYLENERTV